MTVLDGIFGPFFVPAADAQIADVVPEEKRTEVFSLLHMGLNIGAAAGPLIGASFFSTSPRVLFYIAAGAMLLTAILIGRFVPETKPIRRMDAGTPIGDERDQETTLSRASSVSRHTNLRDYSLVAWTTVLSLPITLLYTQVQTNLPLYLSHRFTGYTHIYAIMTKTPRVRIRKMSDLRLEILNRTSPIETGVEWGPVASPESAKRAA